MANLSNQVKVVNRLLSFENVADADIVVQAQSPGPGVQPVKLKTDRQGVAHFPAKQPLTDGTYKLTITPAATTSDEVGPAVASTGPVPDRIFRTMNLTVLVRGGLLSSIISGGEVGGKASAGGGILKVELQPVFIKSPNSTQRNKAIDLIIIHHTSGPTIQSAINQFLTNGTTSSHYLVDTDGQIVKMVPDSQAAWHAGVTHWAEQTALNANSIGIEIVNKDGDPFTEPQYSSVLGLINRVMSAYPNIPPRRVVGHSDVGTNEAGRLGRKSSCPGSQFEWVRLEKAGKGLIPSAAATGEAIYGKFFLTNPHGSFRPGDKDDGRVWGGKKHAQEIAGNPVQELQKDLAGIGYSVGEQDGSYDEKTSKAVQMLQEHFFAGGRGGRPNGLVDLTTATLIKQLVKV